MASSELPPPERLQIPVHCDWCEVGAPGKHYCTVCRKTLCINCESNHARLFMDHRVVPRSEMAICKDLECADHVDQNVTLYCEVCLCPICVDCVTGKHRLHPVTKLSAAVKEEKVKLQKQISYMEENDISSIFQTLSDLQKAEDTYKKEVRNTNKGLEDGVENIKVELDKIKAEMDNVKADLDRDLADRRKNLLQTELHDLARFNDLRKQLKHREDSVKYQIAERKEKINSCDVNPAGFLKFIKSDKTGKELPAHPHEPLPVFMHTSTSHLTVSEILKKINLQHIVVPVPQFLKLITPQILSSLKADVQGSPRICARKDGNVWIGGSRSREISLINNSGKVLNRRKIHHQPYDMAITASGDMILSPNSHDSKSIIRMGINGKETVIYDAAPQKTQGLSVTSDQQILICSSMGKLVKCNADGTNVQEIYNKGAKNSAVLAIELPERIICISDWSINGLVIFDTIGGSIMTITQPLGNKDYLPLGLAFDKMGNILSVDLHNNCVCIIDQKRQVKELLGASHGLKKPSRLAIDPQNNLWVAQEDGTITVIKYLA